MSHLVAVYGTLKKNGWNHGILYGSKYVGDALVPGYELFEYGFPVALPVIKDHDKTKVRVELYEIDQACLGRMDRLEYEGVMFNRTKVTALPVNRDHLVDEDIPCEMYIGSTDYFAADRMRRVQPLKTRIVTPGVGTSDGEVYDWKPLRSMSEAKSDRMEKETENETVRLG